MAEFTVDPYADRYARRTVGMSASEVRALFAVASRPDVVSLAGGMPFVQALPTEHVLEAIGSVIAERADVALQYGGGQGSPVLRERLGRITIAPFLTDTSTVSPASTCASSATDLGRRRPRLLPHFAICVIVAMYLH